jgi:hypothetical protein
MHRTHAVLATLLLLTTAAWTSGCKSGESEPPEGPRDVAPAVGTVEDDAVEIVRSAAHLLRDADAFAVTLETGFDVVQDSGQKIEFGSTRRAQIQRPNRARFEWQRRDGKEGVVVFDGNDIWAYSPTHEVYAHTEQPGDIDASIELITEDLGIESPLADMFTQEVGMSLADGLTDCFVVGTSTVRGVACDHVAVRNDYADYQLWIASGDQPLLQRIVITYREEEGEPQFWAELSDWSMGVADAGAFVFQPPAGAERILFNSIRPVGEE